MIKVEIINSSPYIDGKRCSFGTNKIRSNILELAEVNTEFVLPKKYTYVVTEVNGFAKIVKRKEQPTTIPKSAKETLYNSLMQSWQKISAYDHEEKNNHILIAESYGLDELVKYFNETINE